MKNYILYSTLIGVFSEALYVDIGFEFKLVYIIFFVNYILMLKSGYKPMINKYWLGWLIYLLITGIVTVFLYNNQFSKVAFQVFGISFMSLYFYNIFLWYEFDVIEVFEKYCHICYILSLIGIPLFLIIVSFNSLFRLQSLLREPAHFCGIVLPAYYYYMTNFKRFRKKFIVIFLALLMSISSIGYIGMLLGLIMIKKKVNLIVTGSLIILSLIVGFLAYNYIDIIKFRADDTFGILGELDVSNVNSSTMALATNGYVAYSAFKSNPLIGRGIGSHPISFDKYVYEITGIENYFDNEGLLFLNATDAASLTFRIFSELGLIAFMGVIYFIVKYYTSDDAGYKISRGIILYFSYKLFREGHYFPNEMYFFVVCYCFLPGQLAKAKLKVILPGQNAVSGNQALI